MSQVLKGLALTLGIAVLGLVAFYLWATSEVYPRASYAETVAYGDDVPPEQDEITVVSYNIGYLSGLANAAYVPAEGEEPNQLQGQAFFEQNLETAIATLRPLQPDLLAMQEIDINSNRSYHVHQVNALADGLKFPVGSSVISWNKRYVPFPLWPPSEHFGQVVAAQAVLSRFPIENNERVVLEKVASNPFFYNALYLDRLAQVTTLRVNQQPVILINIHLEAFDNPTRVNQTNYVKALAENYAKEYPVLLVGDFNSAVNRPEEGDIKSIELMNQSSVLTPAIPIGQYSDPAQATYPSNKPAYKLDYIFYTPATIEMIEARVMSELGQTSDHLPIAMKFRLRR